MKDQGKTKNLLIAELVKLRKRVAKLEKFETSGNKPEQTFPYEHGLVETIFDNHPDFLYFKDKQARFQHISKRFYEFFGLGKEDIIGKTDLDLFPEQVAEQTYNEDLQVIRTGTPLINKEEYAKGVWVLTTKIPWLDKDGNIIGLFGISHDITLRKQAEIILKENEQRFKILFEKAPDAIYLADTKGIFIDGNLEAEKITGYKREELIGKSFLKLKLLSSGQLAKAAKNLVKSIIGQPTGPDEYTLNRKDGKKIVTEIRTYPVKIKEKSLLLGIARDITDRKLADEQIKNQNILLEEAVNKKQQEMELLMEQLIRQEKLAAVGKISASIAHELRNPLAAIKQSIFFLNRLQQNDKLESSGAKVKEHLELIKEEIDESNRVITDLLQSTKIGPLDKQQVNLRTIISAVLDRCSVKEDTKIKIDLNPEAFFIWADTLQMRQVLVNIVSNANQAIAKNGEIAISAVIPNGGQFCSINIQDNGPGISAENLSKVFEPLYTSKPKGIGLGLSICKQIVENHGGSITMTSKIGKGTTVNIQLPNEAD